MLDVKQENILFAQSTFFNRLCQVHYGVLIFVNLNHNLVNVVNVTPTCRLLSCGQQLIFTLCKCINIDIIILCAPKNIYLALGLLISTDNWVSNDVITEGINKYVLECHSQPSRQTAQKYADVIKRQKQFPNVSQNG